MAYGSFNQYDSRWGSKNYNGSSTMAAAGCGPTACANILYNINPSITPVITMKYMQTHGDDKHKTFALYGQGTAWNGIPSCLKYFGATKVKEQNVGKTMDAVWNVMAKGHVSVLLFSKGTKGGITWTTAGHYLAAVGYKVKNGKHYLKMEDSGGRGHDGWYCYETQMRGLISKAWTCLAKAEEREKPTGKYSGSIAKPTLKKGAQGEEVKKLQQFLTWYGIKTNDDGKFGAHTGESVAIFQAMEGLTIDEVYGKKSYAAAKKYVDTTTPTTPTTTPTDSSQSAAEPVVEQPSTTPGAVIGKCIDVSYWQNKISVDNWKKIKKTCDYAICRASYTALGKFSLAEDSTFAVNAAGAKYAGLKVGAYHFSQALTVAEAKKEAQFFCDVLDKYNNIDFWVACDYETNSSGRLNSKTVSKKASEITNAFCDVVKQRGYPVCIYTYYSLLVNYLKEPKYPIWLAQYNNTMSYKKNVIMWQYTSSARVSGIEAKNTNNKSANVDMSNVYSLPPIKPIPEPTPTQPELKSYDGKFPEPNTNAKIVNGMCYRMCYPYGTPENKYTYAKGKPREAYAKGIDEAFPNHMEWSNKKQRVGACCDMLPGTILRLIGINSPKHLKDQCVELPKMTDKLQDNGHYRADDFVLGDFIQRLKSDGHGHTWFVCELINGKKYIANAHYRKLDGAYAVMDAVPSTIRVSKYAIYHCYTILGAIRTDYRLNDYGYDVLYIQKFLNWYGIKVTEDGDYGKNTEAAVKVFQEAMGLTIDGHVGKKTIAMMKKVKK